MNDSRPDPTSPRGGAGALPASAGLFDPLHLRSVTLRNRIVLSPMAQYSAEDGIANDWHLVHYGSRAVGGAGALVVEATAVLAEGRITPGDLGLWREEQVAPLARVASFIEAQGAVPAIQLAHAGRKASTGLAWQGGQPLPPGAGGWVPAGPSSEAFATGYTVPRAMTTADIEAVVEAFRAAARRARRAGFQLVEVHAAHGYLIHEFLSPLVNRRTDRHGGAFENRTRLALEVTRAVRSVWPEDLPVWVRISATDWAAGGWNVEEAVRLAALLREAGVDLVDCSSAGAVAHQEVAAGPGFQVPFAARIRREAGVRTGAVGFLTEPAQADAILREGKADVILLGRVELREPYWPLHAARALGVDLPWPGQYFRGKPEE
jgi:2,4-dienoyl-CoA reductase-like NADH-dependent reductase (Old Yellow Enzyme family)